MPEREAHVLDRRVCSVDEACDGEVVGLVDRARARDRVGHGARDDDWVDHGEVEVGVVGLHECPGGLLALYLGDVVAEHDVLAVDGLLGGYLR